MVIAFNIVESIKMESCESCIHYTELTGFCDEFMVFTKSDERCCRYQSGKAAIYMFVALIVFAIGCGIWRVLS